MGELPSAQQENADEEKHSRMGSLLSEPRLFEKKLLVKDGVLQLHPLVNPCEGLFQVFLLTKVMWFLIAELDAQEKSKHLEREIDFAQTELGYTFVDANAPDRTAPDSVVASAVLGWIEQHVVKEMPAATFQRLRHALEDMRTNCAVEDNRVLDTHQHRHHRAHRFQQAIESTRSGNNEDDLTVLLNIQTSDSTPTTRPTTTTGTQEETADAPRPLGASSRFQSNPLPDLGGVPENINFATLFESVDSLTLKSLTGNSGANAPPPPPVLLPNPVSPEVRTKAVAQTAQLQEAKMPACPIRRTSPRRTRHAEGQPAEQAPKEPNPDQDTQELLGAKRTLEELKTELHAKHVRCKRRRVEPNDVVSGKGERAKQQNEGYRELIRANAPAFRGVNTGDAEKDLEHKRKLAYRIALTVVERGGRFFGKDGEVVEASLAYKRCMVSLKDWKPPSEKRAAASRKNKPKQLTKDKTKAASAMPPERASNPKPPTKQVAKDDGTSDILGPELEEAIADYSDETWFHLSFNPETEQV